MNINVLQPLLGRIDRLKCEKPHVIIAIDGQCGSGKSTLAQTLSEYYGAPVLHMDDFFLQPHQRTKARLEQPGGNVDAERFLREVLAPLREAKPFAYRPFSCREQRLMEPVAMDVYPLAFVEGSYSLHPLLADQYDLRIVLTIDPDLQRERIRLREGEEKLACFESLWIPLENAYFAGTKILERCDMTLHTGAESITGGEEEHAE